MSIESTKLFIHRSNMIDIFCLLKKLIRRMHDKENFCREKLIVLNQSKVFCRYFLFIKKLTRKLHNKENSCRQEIVDTLSDDESASTAAQGCSWRRIEACNNTFSKWQGFDIRNKHLRKCIIVNTLRYIYYRPSLSSVSVSKSLVTSCTNCFLFPSRHAVPSSKSTNRQGNRKRHRFGHVRSSMRN